jgi:hypothetical protein
VIGKSQSALHMKSAVLDHRQVFLGSMNLDPRSVRLNTELGLIIDSLEMAAQLDAMVDLAAHQLRLGADGHRIEWIERDGEGRETVHLEEPETSPWLRSRAGWACWCPCRSCEGRPRAARLHSGQAALHAFDQPVLVQDLLVAQGLAGPDHDPALVVAHRLGAGAKRLQAAGGHVSLARQHLVAHSGRHLGAEIADPIMPSRTPPHSARSANALQPRPSHVPCNTHPTCVTARICASGAT